VLWFALLSIPQCHKSSSTMVPRSPRPIPPALPPRLPRLLPLLVALIADEGDHLSCPSCWAPPALACHPRPPPQLATWAEDIMSPMSERSESSGQPCTGASGELCGQICRHRLLQNVKHIEDAQPCASMPWRARTTCSASNDARVDLSVSTSTKRTGVPVCRPLRSSPLELLLISNVCGQVPRNELS
jgi:hypothetical protein